MVLVHGRCFEPWFSAMTCVAQVEVAEWLKLLPVKYKSGTAPKLEVAKSLELSRGLSDFAEIWYVGAL